MLNLIELYMNVSCYSIVSVNAHVKVVF